MPLEMNIHNVDVVFKRVQTVGDRAPQFITSILERCMKLDVWPRWVRAIGLTDHSLEDLAKLGHPYSTRYGKDSFVHPDYQVHNQTGNLVSMSKIESRPLRVTLTNDSREYIYLRYGTRTMRPRDPGGAILADAMTAIRARLRAEIHNSLLEILTK